MRIVKRLLDWRSPIIEELQVLDLVFQNKLLLLVTWRTQHVYRISFPLLKKSYRDAELAVVLLLPANVKSIDIVFRNKWKSHRETVALKKLTLSPELSLQIIQDFKPFKLMSVQEWQTPVLPILTQAIFQPPHITSPDLQMTSSSLSLYSSEFEYTNNQTL